MLLLMHQNKTKNKTSFTADDRAPRPRLKSTFLRTHVRVRRGSARGQFLRRGASPEKSEEKIEIRERSRRAITWGGKGERYSVARHRRVVVGVVARM